MNNLIAVIAGFMSGIVIFVVVAVGTCFAVPLVTGPLGRGNEILIFVLWGAGAIVAFGVAIWVGISVTNGIWQTPDVIQRPRPRR